MALAPSRAGIRRPAWRRCSTPGRCRCSARPTTAARSPGPGPSTACPPSRSPATPGSRAARWAAPGCAAIVAAYDHAIEAGAPVIGLWHSGGARLREGVESLHAVGTVFAAMTRASGKVPQISVVLGPAAGGAAYGPALTDLVILSEPGPHLRHRTRRGAQRDRRGRRLPSGSAGPSRTAAGPAWCTWSPRATRRRSSQARRLALLLGQQEGDGPAARSSGGTDLARCCPSRRAAPTTCTR